MGPRTGPPTWPNKFCQYFDGLVVLVPAVWIVELCVPGPDFSVLRRLCHDLRRTLHEHTHAFWCHWQSAVNKAATSKGLESPVKLYDFVAPLLLGDG